MTRCDQPVGAPGEILCAATPSCKVTTASPRKRRTSVDSRWVAAPGGHGLETGLRATCASLGRYKDMLKIGGENVDPLEVEAYLASHPAINAAAVVGLPDTRLSEVAAPSSGSSRARSSPNRT